VRLANPSNPPQVRALLGQERRIGLGMTHFYGLYAQVEAKVTARLGVVVMQLGNIGSYQGIA
jgi:hypothetical protein